MVLIIIIIINLIYIIYFHDVRATLTAPKGIFKKTHRLNEFLTFCYGCVSPLVNSLAKSY